MKLKQLIDEQLSGKRKLQEKTTTIKRSWDEVEKILAGKKDSKGKK